MRRNKNARALAPGFPDAHNSAWEWVGLAAAGSAVTFMGNALSDEEIAAFAAEIERLREEHRDLDAAIAALQAATLVDQLQLQRLKKRKLALRDRIAKLEDLITPDIIA